MTDNTQGARKGHTFILSMLASLFFMWGFISVLQDILVPHLKSVFDLNYTQSLLVSCTWFVTYFVMSLPSAFLLQRLGYKKCLVTGLVGMTGGLGGFYLASSLGLSKQITGSYQAGLLIFAGLAFVALLGVGAVRKRWTTWARPAVAQAQA
jgi:fucose permease